MNELKRSIRPFSYHGHLAANASKSYFQRAMAIASLASDSSELKNIQWSADTRAVKSLIDQLGAKTTIKGQSLFVTPATRSQEGSIELNVGESGLALRMFSSIATLFNPQIRLTGHGSLLERPVLPITETLEAARIEVVGQNDKPPIDISGSLTGGIIKIDGSFSSQILTGLLISLPLINNDSEIQVSNLTSRPYIDMTLDIMKRFGVHVEHSAYETFHIQGNQEYQGMTYAIEGDWSGAANHLVGAAISGEITMTGLNPRSRQADRAILNALEMYGADIKIKEDELIVRKHLAQPFEFDASQCPDIFPPLVALAASCLGTSRIIGTDRLLHKESNRLVALIETFKNLGVEITTQPNELIVHGTGKVKGGEVDSFNDHRIAMVAAVATTMSQERIVISRPAAIAKSYPRFYDDLEKVSKP